MPSGVVMVAAFGEAAEQPVCLFAVVHGEKVSRAAHRLGIVIVGCVEQNARSFEARMHDLAAHRRGRGGDIVAFDFRDFAQSAVGVESERRFAGSL